MSGDTGSLLTLLDGKDPVGVVFYRENDARAALLDLCEMLHDGTRRTTSVEDAFAESTRDQVLLLEPEDEVNAVATLEGRREALAIRNAPVVLFLLRGGDAEAYLREHAPALSSWLRGLTYDPDPPIDEADRAERRRRFIERTSRTPEEWLSAWKLGEISDDAESNFEAQEAWLLSKG